MASGYAIEIKLSRWEKTGPALSEREHTRFTSMRSHYVGSLGTEENATAIYQKLSDALEREGEVQDAGEEHRG